MRHPRTVTLAILAAVALAAATLAPPAVATDAMGKKENLACTACHDKPGSKLLTDKGKYYELTGTLAEYDQIKADFGACTTCHVKKPGSNKLTSRGKRFAEAFGAMDELRAYVMKEHPPATPPPPPGD